MGDEGATFITPQIERRQYRRASLVTQVKCEPQGREELLLTRDISIGGLFIKTPAPLPADSEVTLSFRVRPQAPVITCRGKVVNSLPRLGMGIQFVDLDDSARSAIQNFVDESL